MDERRFALRFGAVGDIGSTLDQMFNHLEADLSSLIP